MTAVRDGTGRAGDVAVVLADFVDQASARQLANRLRAEGVGADVWPAEQAALLVPVTAPPIGPTVVVRRADHATASTMARLFAQVDGGGCPLAPPPRDFWHGSPQARLFGAGLVLIGALCVLILLVAVATV